MKVGNTEAPSNSVVILATGVKRMIGKQGARRETPNATKLYEKFALQLIEALKDVGGATCGMLPSEFGILQ